MMKHKSYNSGWVKIGEFNSLPDASIVAGAIENEGIPTSILNSSLQSTLPLTYTWAPVELLVPRDSALQAQKLVPDDNKVAFE